MSRLRAACRFADGSLNSNFDIKRLDGPGGNFALRAAYANADQKLDLDLKVSEPANGIVANLLKIDGRPPVDLTLTGAGTLDDLKVALALDTNGSRTLTGEFTLDRQGKGPDGGRVLRRASMARSPFSFHRSSAISSVRKRCFPQMVL